MNFGTIMVQVYTSRGKIPISEASILVKREKEVLALAISDENGQSRVIEIPTPPLVETVVPPKILPYTLVDVLVEHPNFIRKYLKNVQIFPETDSVLPVELLPLAEGGSSLVDETQIRLPVQDL